MFVLVGKICAIILGVVAKLCTPYSERRAMMYECGVLSHKFRVSRSRNEGRCKEEATGQGINQWVNTLTPSSAITYTYVILLLPS